MGKNTRSELRADLLKLRSAISVDEKKILDLQLALGIYDYIFSIYTKNLTVGLYQPIRGEPDLSVLYAKLAQSGIQIALPVVVERQSPLRFVPYQLGDPMRLGQYGIAEPMDISHNILPDIVVIPCLGFSEQNYRLGYGGGFYDRTLASWQHECTTLGVAYERTKCDFEPNEFDVALEVILRA
ncbi:MAG: 5-formyltetrahydrofolate cyclo-ligase [Formosimonas sp.]